MANVYDQIDAVMNPSQNYATGFLTGQRAGGFQAKDGTVNRGVWVGNSKPTIFNLINPQNAYEESLTLSSSQYLPLNNFQQSAFLVPNFGIVLDAPRSLTFTGTEPFSVNVSSYSIWGQPQYETVESEEVGEAYEATTWYGVKTLTSVYLNTSVSNEINFIADETIELPYTDNGDGINLSQVILTNQPLMYVPESDSPPYAASYNFTYFPATLNPFTNVRPQIEFLIGGTTGVTYEDNSILTIVQLVDNTGFTFDNNFLDLDNPYPNNIEKVIGIAPNSTNFTTWQG